MRAAPFPPLVANGAGLDQPRPAPIALRRRMAEVYGLDEACVLPVRGVAHGVEVILRRVALDGGSAVASDGVAEVSDYAPFYRLDIADARTISASATFVASPDIDGGVLSGSAARGRASETAPGLLVVDERLIEFSDAPSAVSLIGDSDNLIVLRSLELAYGLAGAPCAVLVAGPNLIKRLEEACEPNPLATPTLRLAEAALDPSRAVAYAGRVAEVKSERARMREALGSVESVRQARGADGPFVFVTPRDVDAARKALRSFGVQGVWRADGVFRLDIRDRASNDRALAAFGVDAAVRAQRTAEVIRETTETKIVARVNLDAAAPVTIDTGVAFYDHMLSQVAVHGGFALTLTCAGDLDIDAHHTVEDCALALGQALSQALDARRGIARFGFVLPMDEAQAQVSVDLGGRPYLVFDGAFTAPALGAYATEMTEHVFRSLAQSMGAAIHVSVTGENDHHKTEACFKAFGRALRQAIRIEGEAVPSSKGVI